MKKQFLLLVISQFILLNALICQPDFVKDSLNTYVIREMKKWQIPGLALTIVKDGKIIECKGYGTTENGGDFKIDENTLFQIASNSKAFTGTALAILEVQKKLNLDDKVKKWLPYFKLNDVYAENEATIKDLLCHRIGFQTFQSDFLNWNCNLSRTEIIKGMKNVKAVNSFRSKYGYCNSAFLAAGEIIPAVCDTSWDDFLVHRFFKPLKMERSSTRWKKIISDKNAARPYTILNNKLEQLSYANIDNLGPAASINSCVKDLSNWIVCQLDSGKFENKCIIPYKAIASTRFPQIVSGRGSNPNYPGNHFSLYGLGWGIKDVDGKVMYEHTGGADGFVTSVCIIPELKLGIAVLTNTDVNSLFLALREQIIQAYLEKPYTNLSERYFKSYVIENSEQQKEYSVLKQRMLTNRSTFQKPETLVGKYSNEVYGVIEMKYENNNLVLYFPNHNQTTGKLSYLGDNEFLCEYSYKTWGIQKIKLVKTETNNPSFIIKVNDFVDFLEYEFQKM